MRYGFSLLFNSINSSFFFQIHEVRQYCEHAYSKVHVPESVPDYIILKITGKPDLVKNLLTNEPR